MPSVMNLLDKAVLLVGELEEDEEQNYVRKHYLLIVRTRSGGF
ncbi:MAG: cobaltochelatase subunit CobN [Phascolarctobacterium faecium]